MVPSSGFYEWFKPTMKHEKKVPFLVNTGNNVLLMAGVYDVWKSGPGNDDVLYSFAIVTTEASQQFEWLHNRQPCILSTTEDVQKWLDTGNLSGVDASNEVLRTLEDGFVWRQMNADLSKALTEASTRVGPVVSSYFKDKWTKGEKKPRDTTDEGKSGVKRIYDSAPDEDDASNTKQREAKPLKPSTPIRKKAKGGASGQRTITSFFRKR